MMLFSDAGFLYESQVSTALDILNLYMECKILFELLILFKKHAWFIENSIVCT